MHVRLQYFKPLGPRATHGDVTLLFERGKPRAFASNVTWPSENLDGFVRKGIEEAVEALGDRHPPAAVTLIAIEWDEINSCPDGFRRAARAATIAHAEL